VPDRFNKPPQILYVGRLDPQKAPQIVIEALAGLDEVELTIIGDGSRADRLEALVSRLDLRKRVSFIRSVPNSRIHQYYHRADIFAMATHYEGFCIPVLEAMASGLPVIVCDTPPLPEVLGETGLVVGKNALAFQTAIQELLDKPELAFALGRKAQSRAGAISGQIMEEREAALYRRLLESLV
jgi:glycosyltransferase involved in cell wall biosynthesis